MFSLDFHSPPPASSQTQITSSQPQRNVKDDILSLFSAAPPAGAGVLGGGGGGGAFGNPAATSMVGNAGTGMWGVQSGWNGGAPPAMQSPQQPNIWGPPQANAWSQPTVPQQQSQQPFGTFGGVPSTTVTSFGTQDIWGNATSPALATAGVGGQTNDLFGGSFSTATTQQKKDDAFGDIWGSFK